MTKVQVAQHLLTGIGAPVNHRTMGAMVGWMNAEGGHWANSARFNPLNTTQHAPGSTNPGFSAGVQSYRNWNEGLNATLATLKNGSYGGIIRAFRSSNPQQVASAIGASPWGTSGAGAASAIQAAMGTNFHVNAQPGAPGGAGQAPGAPRGTPGMTTVTNRPVTTSSTNKRAAAAQAFLTESTSAIPTNGKIPTLNPLGALQNNIASGAFTTTSTHMQSTINTVPGTIEGAKARGGAIVASAMGGADAGAPGLAKAVGVAMRAAAFEKRAGVYKYTQDSGGPGDSRTNAGAGLLHKARGASQITFDCSGFVDAVYKAAGLGSPFGTTFTSAGFPTDINHRTMELVSMKNMKPGAIIGMNDHVTLYIGHGKVVNMGAQGQPYVTTVQAELSGHGETQPLFVIQPRGT